LNDKYDKKAQTLLHFSDVQTIGQLVKSNIGITLMTDFIPFRDMENLVKIPLVAKDKEIFYVQYAHLKTAVLNEDLQQLVVMLDKLSKVDDTCANE
ncbi:MAG: LysR family transcriptional regulator, partial [Pseudolactococcus laudensis]